MKFCFDCDDTLYDLEWPFRMSMQEIIPFVLHSKIDITEFYHTYRKYGDDVFDYLHEGKITIDDSGIYRIYKVCQDYDIPLDLEKACDFQDTYVSYQRKISMSDTLKNYFKYTHSELAILTNGEDTHQRMKLKALDVQSYFKEDHIFTSGQLTFAKPDPKAFQAVAENCDSRPQDWFYVGDNYINDIQGGHNAGFKTIHFNRHHGIEGDAADYIVYTEQELVDLLMELEKKMGD